MLEPECLKKNKHHQHPRQIAPPNPGNQPASAGVDGAADADVAARDVRRQWRRPRHHRRT